jgi:hypothetical protein
MRNINTNVKECRVVLLLFELYMSLNINKERERERERSILKIERSCGNSCIIKKRKKGLVYHESTQKNILKMKMKMKILSK